MISLFSTHQVHVVHSGSLGRKLAESAAADKGLLELSIVVYKKFYTDRSTLDVA